VSDIWATLGLAPVRDRDAIRRAYARRLKVTNPEDDAEGFQTLRAAYEEALASLDWDWDWVDEDSGPSDVAVAPVETIIRPRIEPIQATATPPARHAAHAALVDGLEALLKDGSPSADLDTAFAKVLASPDLDDVAVQADTEARIMQLILDHPPASDPLVRRAINAFGWSRAGVISRRDAGVNAVLDRDADIIFRTGLNSESGMHAAFAALSKPLGRGAVWQARLSPVLEDHVRELLREIDTRRPSLAFDLDGDTLAWWRDRLSRPHLAAWMRWFVGGLPLVAAGISCLFPPLSLLKVLLVWAVVQGVTLATAGLYLYAFLKPQAWWRENWAWRAPLWVRAGWGPASVILVLLAGALPVHPAVLALVVLLGAGLLLWCSMGGQPDTRDGAYPWLVRTLMANSYLIGWWLVMLSTVQSPIAPQLIAATGFATYIAMAGAGTLIDAWHGELPRLTRRLALAGLALASLLAAFGLADWMRDPDQTDFPTYLVGLVTAVVLAQRPAMAGLGETALRARHYLMWFALIALRAIGASIEGGWTAIGGLWLLAGVMIGLIGLLFVELEDR
jgi:hypothetical protein